METISSKTVEVAVLPLKFNLQKFAEEDVTPNLEDTPEFKEDAKEFSAMESKMNKFTEERKAKETLAEKPADSTVKTETAKEIEQVAKPEVAVPDEKPKQDMETNKAFQEMRQKLEAAEKAKVEMDAKAKKADDLIALQYGASHGIYTVEQYEQRLQQERDAQDNERYQTAGLKPEEIEKLRKYDELQRETETQKQTRSQEETAKAWQALYDVYPDVAKEAEAFREGKDPAFFTAEMKAEIARGASPLAAYRNAHFETILANATKGTKEVAKQEVLNQLNSKEHIKANATAGGDVDHVDISPEQMRMYRSLNKGKTDAEIRAFHKKQQAGG